MTRSRWDEKHYDWENVFLEGPLIQGQLAARGDAAYAQELRRLLPEDELLYGTPLPAIRRVVREWLESRREHPPEYILSVCELLWSTGSREECIAALAIIFFHRPARAMVDFALLEAWSREVESFEVADHLAGLMGRMLETAPRLLGSVRGLANSDRATQRRLALMTLIVASRDPAWEPGLAAMVERLENDTEPLVRQAVEKARERLSRAAVKRG